jgi:hypothetical protein
METLSARVRQAMCDLFYANSGLAAPVSEAQPESSTI